MTKISNDEVYVLDNTITDGDFVIGTDSNNAKKPTKTYTFAAIKSYALSGLSPELGGTMRISEITYTGVLTTPQAVVNAMSPYLVYQYHLVIVSVNGFKYFLTLQNRTIGTGYPAVLSTDFIVFPTSVGATGNGIASITLFSTVGLVKTYRITYTNASTFDFAVTDGNTGATGNGIASISLFSTVGLVKTYRITYTNATTFDFTVTDGTDASNNLQKTITGNYTIVNGDNNYTIMINNGGTAVNITIPTSLLTKLNVGFFRQGTGEVTFVASGTTIRSPLGLRIKDQHGWAYLEHVADAGTGLGTNIFQLAGLLKT